jgi:hypothetical protein
VEVKHYLHFSEEIPKIQHTYHPINSEESPMHDPTIRPTFGGRVCEPAFYVAVSNIITAMRPNKTLRQIADQLNEFGYKTPRGHVWNKTRLFAFIRNN